MRKMKDVFGAGLSTLLILSMVLGSTTTAFAAGVDDKLDREFNSAYQELIADAKDLTFEAYSGTNEKFGAEKVTGDEAKVAEYWADAQKCLEAYAKKTYGAEATVVKTENDLSGKVVAQGKAGITLDDETYARAYKVTANGNDYYYNIHVADNNGNISFWQKTQNASQEVKNWAKVEADNSITILDESKALKGLIVDHEGSKYVAYAGPTDTSTHEYENFKTTLASNQTSEIVADTEKTVNSVGTITVNDTYGTKHVQYGDTTNYGGFFSFEANAMKKAEKDVETWLNKKAGNTCKVTLHRWFSSKVINISSMSEWTKFWTDAGVFFLGYDVDVDCYEEVTDMTAVTAKHDEVGIIVTHSADVKVTTDNSRYNQETDEKFVAAWPGQTSKPKEKIQELKDELCKDEHVQITGDDYWWVVAGYNYEVYYNYIDVSSGTKNQTISRDFYRADKYDYITVETIPAYWTETLACTPYTVKLFQADGKTAITTIGALPGANVKGIINDYQKKVTKVEDKKTTGTTEPKTAGSYTVTVFNKWVPVSAQATYKVDNAKNVSANMEFKAENKEIDKSNVQFGLRKSNEEVAELNHNYKVEDYLHLAASPSLVKLVEYLEVSGKLKDDETYYKILDQLVGEVPTLKDFVEKAKTGEALDMKAIDPGFEGTVEQFMEKFYIRWYVIKMTGTGNATQWKIDGVVKENPYIKFMNGQTEFTGSGYVQKGSLVTAPTTNPTKEADERYSYSFKGWKKSGDADTEIITDWSNIKANENMTFEAVYDKADVKYTVTFKFRDGTQHVDEYTYEQIPQSISQNDINETTYVEYFQGWTADGKNAYDFTKGITKSVELTPLYNKVNKIKVEFYNDGTLFGDGGYLLPDANITAPDNTPTKEFSYALEYSFIGWKLQNSTANPVKDFGTAKVKDFVSNNETVLKFNAEYDQADKYYNVEFYDRDKNLLKTESVKYGEKVAEYKLADIDTDNYIEYYRGWKQFITLKPTEISSIVRPAGDALLNLRDLLGRDFFDVNNFNFDTVIKENTFLPMGKVQLMVVYEKVDKIEVRFWNQNSENAELAVFDSYKAIPGSNLVLPKEDPEKLDTPKTEYTFKGYKVKGAEGTDVIDFTTANIQVTKELDYEAVYDETVTDFNVVFYNGEKIFHKEKIEAADTIIAPDGTPVMAGDTNNEHAFVGWKVRGAETVAYRSFANMTFKVFDDMGLVKDGLLEFEAVYSKNIPIHNLKFDTDHGQITIGVEHGSTLAEELIPQNSNVPEETLTKVFFGWRAIATPVEENVVTGASLLKVNFFRTEGDPETFNFSTPIEHDYEFEAVYVDVDKIRVSFFDGNTQVGDTQYVTPEEFVQAPTATRVDTETVTNTFLGYRMNGEGDILTVEQINQMNFEADTRFEAAFDVQEVQGAEFENPDDDGEVLGEEFTNPDANTNEQSEVLGASYGKTGDATPIFVVVALLAMSGITLVAFGKRRKENN
ncbi:MAG: LPXTG cell wall anchor domain-containing protein [Lachnospiraceae bacterium]|nr:LPXTG cell wall anchor domain-containing protein [Lachnospiraceae bacterium]